MPHRATSTKANQRTRWDTAVKVAAAHSASSPKSSASLSARNEASPSALAKPSERLTKLTMPCASAPARTPATSSQGERRRERVRRGATKAAPAKASRAAPSALLGKDSGQTNAAADSA
jgi:hypothetical protein